MKTNHQRDFVDPGSESEQGICQVWHSKTSGVYASVGNDFTNGKRGQARSMRGAKKFIRTRDRAFLKREAFTLQKDPTSED